MSEKYNYCKEQLNRLNGSTEYLQLKITSDTGEYCALVETILANP